MPPRSVVAKLPLQPGTIRPQGARHRTRLLYIVRFCLSLVLLQSFVSLSRKRAMYNDDDDSSSSSLSSAGAVPRAPSVSSPRRSAARPLIARNWPGIPWEEPGHKLVIKGRSFAADESSRALLFEYLDEFLEAYAARPDKANMCGVRVNHAFALYATVKRLKPTNVIESGVNAGQSTYFIRKAAANNPASSTKIYAIDPRSEPICGKKRWIDQGGNTEYFTGSNFTDVLDINWPAKSNEVDPSRTLVFLDDHQEAFKRLVTLMKHGFRHFLLDDNYKVNEGALAADRAGWTPKQMFRRIDRDATYLWNVTKAYAEFPPLVDPIVANGSTAATAGLHYIHYADNNTDIMPPILRPNEDPNDKIVYERICKELGIDPQMKDGQSYAELMLYNQICYLELEAV